MKSIPPVPFGFFRIANRDIQSPSKFGPEHCRFPPGFRCLRRLPPASVTGGAVSGPANAITGTLHAMPEIALAALTGNRPLVRKEAHPRWQSPQLLALAVAGRALYRNWSGISRNACFNFVSADRELRPLSQRALVFLFSLQPTESIRQSASSLLHRRYRR